jgi:hypothetical protein
MLELQGFLNYKNRRRSLYRLKCIFEIFYSYTLGLSLSFVADAYLNCCELKITEFTA